MSTQSNFFHTVAPPFTIHVGDEAKGEFTGRRFHRRVPGDIGSARCTPQGFDPAFTSVASAALRLFDG